MSEMTFTLHNPLTEEERDIIEDVDFDHTNSITFHTKHGKDVVFVKCKTGRWEMIPDPYGFFEEIPVCSECGCTTEMRKTYNYCPNCGADMRG